MIKKHKASIFLFLGMLIFACTHEVHGQEMCSLASGLCIPGASNCCPGLTCLGNTDTFGTCIIPPNEL